MLLVYTTVMVVMVKPLFVLSSSVFPFTASGATPLVLKELWLSQRP